ncbi:cell division protein FtsW [Kribbella sp. VKM Ac-2571]|uniref:putative lipid II flippase FtsW n=1 Tax=Kribbella sp. VKM Ac-2571 TaxID=2512222 RepID=UPI00105F7404|nr:putative lipid II flippase FtsW [Kribbella sp. VKM Ac-2571]TDO60847.1 cell division protein FtsW [Kribbella sp. VKM Ac-2571]
MTSIADQPDQKKQTSERAWIAAIKDVLDRPLTSYHIVLGATGLLLVLGLMMVLSASSVLSLRVNGNSYTIFVRQLIWVGVGLPMAYVASRMTPRHFRMLAYVALLGSMFLLVLTYIPGLGVGVNGNTNWLNLGGPLQIQPSEFAKLAMVMWCADLYARKEKLLTQWKHLLVPMVPVCGLVIALVVGQHDLGTALVLMAVMIGMIWIVGAPTRLFVATIAVVGTVAAYFVNAEKYRLDRVTSFLDPFANPTTVGWQAYHSFYALSTGGWWGVGIGNSRQKWSNLPEAHTDFIFSVIGEELGLVGSLTVLALFLTLAYAGVRIATRNTEPFVRYAAAGITIWIMAQTLVNLGAVIGLLPIVGIPLPLLSYGGSALLPTLIAIGMLLSFAKAEPGAQAALKETRRPRFGWLPSRRTAYK